MSEQLAHNSSRTTDTIIIELTERIDYALDHGSLDCLSVTLLLDKFKNTIHDILLNTVKEVDFPSDKVQLELDISSDLPLCFSPRSGGFHTV